MYTGKKVRLREYREEDMPLRLAYVNDPEVGRNLAPGVPYPVTLHEEEKWFESINTGGDVFKFAIESLEDKKFIGGCSINGVDWKNGVTSLGIFIGSSEHRGKGYGTDAMRVLMEFIFMQMNVNKIRLTVYSYNIPGIKCYEKCGFKVEGVLRREIFRDGKYYDKILMGILREEYLENR